MAISYTCSPYQNKNHLRRRVRRSRWHIEYTYYSITYKRTALYTVSYACACFYRAILDGALFRHIICNRVRGNSNFVNTHAIYWDQTVFKGIFLFVLLQQRQNHWINEWFSVSQFGHFPLSGCVFSKLVGGSVVISFPVLVNIVWVHNLYLSTLEASSTEFCARCTTSSQFTYFSVYCIVNRITVHETYCTYRTYYVYVIAYHVVRCIRHRIRKYQLKNSDLFCGKKRYLHKATYRLIVREFKNLLHDFATEFNWLCKYDWRGRGAVVVSVYPRGKINWKLLCCAQSFSKLTCFSYGVHYKHTLWRA